MDFILNNWAELILGLMAFVKVVINITPTEKDVVLYIVYKHIENR